MAATEETPPWHSYDGCYGCRIANAIMRRVRLFDLTQDGQEESG